MPKKKFTQLTKSSILAIMFFGMFFGMFIFMGATVSMADSMVDERKLSGEEITKLLSGATVYGKSSSQTFAQDGTTNYNASGKPSSGRWRVEDDQYCSVWPPATSWVCYDVLLDEKDAVRKIIWISESGARSEDEIR